MAFKGKKALRLLLTVCLMATLVMTFCVQAFAWTAGATNIKSGVLTIPEDVSVLSENTVPLLANAYGVKKIEMPSSVTKIESGAFSNCDKLTEVSIDNYEGGVTIEKGAFSSGVKINYLQEKPTVAAVNDEPTTQPPTTATPATTKAPTTTKAPSKKVAEKVTEKTTAEETTEESTTEEESTTVEVTDETPFADAKEQLADVDVWDKLISETTGEAVQPIQKTNKSATVASYAAVIAVAVSAVGLGYLKFKK